MPRTRRAFLTDIGRTSLGLVVVGAAGCSGGDPTVEVPTDAPTATGDAAGTPADPSEQASPATPTPAALQSLLVDLDFVAAYVVLRGGEAVVVDTGTAGSEGAIEAVLTAAGLGWGDVADVVVTHSHGDHAGSLAAIAALAPDAALHAGELDIPAMSAPREILAVGAGDLVHGIEVIPTPGHTPGHIALFDRASGTLWTGDALTGEDGAATGPNRQFTPDMANAIASVGVLAELPVEQVLVAHGFPVTGGQAELQALADRL